MTESCRGAVCTSRFDPLAGALAEKAVTGAAGAVSRRTLAAGEGWCANDFVCTCGPRDTAFEERHDVASISLVLAGTFACRSVHGVSLLSPGSLFLGSAGQDYECSHHHGEGDRCLSFRFGPELFERLVHDAGGLGVAFSRNALPPLRGLARVTARAKAAMEQPDQLEEIALELAGAAVQTAGQVRVGTSAPPGQHASPTWRAWQTSAPIISCALSSA